MELPILLIVIVIALAFMAITASNNAARLKTWEKVADRLGLGFDGIAIEGTIDDIHVHVWTEERGRKSKTTYTIFSAALDGTPPFGLSLAPEDFLRKVRKLVGMEDIQLDLPGIDEHLMVRADKAEEVRAWAARAAVSRGLMDLIALNVPFEVTHVEIRVEFDHPVADGERIESLLSSLAHIARGLSGGGYGALTDDGDW